MEAILPVLLFVAIAAAVSVGLVAFASVVGPRRRGGSVKAMPYESGMDPVHDTRRRYDVRFHLVAITFLVFDVELLFLYPWSVSAYTDQHIIPAELSDTVFGVMLVFMTTLAIAFVYAWRKGVFRWR